MHYQDGWEILHQLRSEPDLAAIPVVIASILDQREQGVALGVRDYLVKPLNEDLLLVAVRRWIPDGTTVLVIDDDPEARLIVRSALEGVCRVIEASDGQQGLELVQSAQPNLVVLDLMMPQMDGFSVLDRLRANPISAQIPVIVVTAKDLEPAERAWLSQRVQLLAAKSESTAETLLAVVGQFVKMPVEDNPDNLFILTDILHEDIKVKYYNARASGKQLFKLLESQPTLKVDIIFLDIQIPYEDGYTVLKQIRNLPRLQGVLVVAVTANVLPQDVERARRSGFDGFIGKPIDADRFPHQFRRLLCGEAVWEPQ